MPFLNARTRIRFRMGVEDFLAGRPGLFALLGRLPRKLRRALNVKNEEAIFTQYFQRNQWGDGESCSGAGSNLFETRTIREALPPLLRKYGIRSVLDVPCGDFHWMKEVDLGEVRYTGGDIVRELVDANNRRYGTETVDFLNLNIILDPLPEADLVFVRDCLVHFSYTDVFRALRNVCGSGSHYLLMTTFSFDHRRNRDIWTGDWRPLNFRKEPFGFPEPLEVLRENHPLEEYSDKSLGLWRIRDVRDRLV